MLDRIIKFSIRNKLIIGIMTVLLIVWGLWSASKLPIDAVPDITNNQVQIITVCPTLASQEVEQLVTFPIEQSIANIPGLEETRSISRFGLSVVTVIFRENVDIYFARQLVSEQLKEAQEDIPPGIGTPELGPLSTGLGEVYQYILHPKKGSEGKYNAKDLRTMQDWIVARQLNGTEGIAEVNSFGGELKQYEVSVNPDRLKAMDVSITDIFNVVQKNNQNTGGAYIEKNPNAYFIRGIGMVTSLEDIGNIAVRNVKGSIPIFIKDVAEVRLGSALRYGAMTYNGEVDAVGGVVMMLKGANSNEVVRRIREKIPVIQKSLPDDIVIEPFLDRTDLIGKAISTVEKNLIEGALIVIFILVLFLGNFRAGLIVASAIPLSMLFALGMMKVFGVSANLMSLGAIDFGLIVDGAVIITEATLHLLASGKITRMLTRKEMDDVVEKSAEKMMHSAVFGQIIILIVYIPILTLTGVEGKMFRPMAQTVSFAILGALILSLTYIPMMCALFLSGKPKQKKSFSDRMMDFVMSIYQPLLKKAIRVKYWLVGGTLALFVLTVLLFRSMGAEFIPQLQEGDFAFHCILPPGSSLTQSIETSGQASRIIRRFDEVRMVVAKTGSAEVPTDPMPPETSDLIILLKPKKEWKERKSYDELSKEILEKLEVIPGVFFESNQPIQMRFNELMTGIRQDVAIKIFGENLDTLSTYAGKVSQLIQDVAGVSEPQVEQVEGLPQINVTYNRTRLANYGLNVEDVNSVLSTAFAGKKAGVVYENERRFDLVIRLDSTFRSSIEDVRNLVIPTINGNQIPLSQVADIQFKTGPAQISREEGKRRIVVGFNVSDRDVQSVVEEIQNRLDGQIHLPTGYYFTYGGQFENLQQASQRLLLAVPLSLLLIFVMLYFTFRSMKQAALIFTAIPMSAIGGVFALLIRGMPFSISAGVGFIALFGVAVLNGIVLISTFNDLKKEGITDMLTLVLTGTKERLRPVMMTAGVASLGFLPMALSGSAGAEVQRPLATVVIGGLITATFLTLFVLPLLYIIFNSKVHFKKVHKMKTTILVVLFLLGPVAGNFAQSKRVLSIDDAIAIATKNNGDLKAKSLEIQSASALKRTAGELPKLDFNTQLGQYSSYQFDNGFQVSQAFPFPGLFKARKELAEADVRSKEWQRALSANELTKQVRTWYYEILYLHHYQKELLHIDSLYGDFIRIAELRYKTGDIKKVEVSTAKAKKGEINLMVRQNEISLKKAYQNLRILMNDDEAFEIINRGEMIPLQLNGTTDSSGIADHPAIMALHQDAILSERRQSVEKALGLPDFKLGYTNQSLIGYQSVNGAEKYFDGGYRFNVVNIGITVPLTFRATRARMKSLELKKQAAEAEATQQQMEMNAQLKNALLQYHQYLQKYQYYQEQALPNAEDIVSAAQLGYRTGDISYVEFLYALQTAAQIRLDFLNTIREVNLSVIDIYSITNQ